MKTKFTNISVIILLLLITITTHAQNWFTTGNSGINSGINFLGTTDGKALVLRTNNVERMRITSQGNIGIGINSPIAKLQINNGKAVQYSGGGYIVIGNTNKDYMALDTNTIQARANNSFSTLYLNPFGGTIHIGSLNVSTSTGAIVQAINTGLTATGDEMGVYGGAGNSDGYGGYFYNPDGIGVYGYSGGFHQAIYGFSGYGDAIYGFASSGGTGVYGFSAHGYGVYGVAGDSNSYAGYFDGNLYTTGTFQTSDEKLKQNIHDVSSAIDIIKQLHPKQYQYRQDGNYKLMHLPQGNHYGLIAQDVEKILPALVKDSKFDVDKAIVKEQKPFDPKNPTAKLNNEAPKTGEAINFKALNYSEFIPILIKGMQEQQAQIENQQQAIDELKQINQQQQEQINQLKNLVESKLSSANVASFSFALSNAGSLFQNVPNPYKNNTVIKYSLPAKFSSAQIIIADNTGKVLKQLNISGSGKGSVNINTSSLAAGNYNYSLWIDGKLIDTKQMILTK